MCADYQQRGWERERRGHQPCTPHRVVRKSFSAGDELPVLGDKGGGGPGGGGVKKKNKVKEHPRQATQHPGLWAMRGRIAPFMDSLLATGRVDAMHRPTDVVERQSAEADGSASCVSAMHSSFAAITDRIPDFDSRHWCVRKKRIRCRDRTTHTHTHTLRQT